MPILYTTQPDLEPIEFTHFDCWEEAMEENNWTLPQLHLDIIHSWEESLGITLLYAEEENAGHDGHLYGDTIWDVVCFRVLQGGYSVYSGDNFIEIYDYEGEEE